MSNSGPVDDPPRATDRAVAQATAELLRQGSYSYTRVGYDWRILEFRPDRRFGRGESRCEKRWRVVERDGKVELIISGLESVTCVLEQGKSGSWEGRWVRHEKMPVELRPIDGSAIDSATLDQRICACADRFLGAQTDRYAPVQMYRRTVASPAAAKQLLAVENRHELGERFGRKLGDIARHVVFFKLEGRRTGSVYWAKLYLEEYRLQLPLEIRLYAHLSDVSNRVVSPVDYHRDYGLIFPFVEEVFRGAVVHFWDRNNHFDPEQVRQIETFASHEPTIPGLPRLPLHELTDFQSVATANGLTYIDFTLRSRFWPYPESAE